MNDFKLIAIRPRAEEGSKFMKVLKKDAIYKFYNDYEFKLENEKVIIKYKPIIPENLFNVKSGDRELSINISALVGKNGSGKSSLIELIFAAMYNLAAHIGILVDDNNNNLPLENDIYVDIYYSLGTKIYCLTIEKNNPPKLKQKNHSSISRINVKFKIAKFLSKHENNYKRLLNDFLFYTIAINYSTYGLNSIYTGDWISHLFHKNDGYQTPLVINPYRKEGNININNENDLVKQRLLSNILEPILNSELPENSLRNLAPNKIASEIILQVNTHKLSKDKLSVSDEKCIIRLFETYTKSTIHGTFILNQEFTPELFYIIKKLRRICENYDAYSHFLIQNDFNEEMIETLIKQICDDSSHITYKIKQALNYLKYKKEFNFIKTNNIIDSKEEFFINIESLSKIIEDIKSKDERKQLKTIELIPPSFFNIKIKFEGAGYFDDFSSGEKQKIHTLHSIGYHLMNINSVFYGIDLPRLYKYKFINIIFDEVELYFHPDLQRTFINDLLFFLQKINPINILNIDGINICFSTHSPFILSDIPNNNILRLENGNPLLQLKKDRPFGANIHDLLSNDFFMNDGFMGEFAKHKIKNVISYLQNCITNKTILNDPSFNKKDIEKFINMIGEPLIREGLENMYNQVFLDEIEIEKRIQELIKLKNNL